jgi:hypothetical protein
MKTPANVTRAIKKYGAPTCREAHRLNEAGEGASTIGFMTRLTTRQADAAITAGRWIHENAAGFSI